MAKKDKHTPGPWKLCEVMGTIQGNGYRIANIPDWNEREDCKAEQLATARLIITAPDFLRNEKNNLHVMREAVKILYQYNAEDIRITMLEQCCIATEKTIAEAEGK